MLCVIAKIDSASRDRLVELQRFSENIENPSQNLHGHITLVSYVGDAEEEFIASCKEILQGHVKFTVHYEKIEILMPTCIIVASPVKEKELAALQQKIAKIWEEEIAEWMWEDVWYPHTTLVHNTQIDLEPIAELMREKFEPFDAQIERIEFSRVKEDGYEIIDFVDL